MEQKGKSSAVCVVFDVNTGRIVHTHTIVTMGEAEEPTDEEVVAEGLQIAQDQPHAADLTLDALIASKGELEHGIRYRVDTTQQRLVPTGEDRLQAPNSVENLGP